ncbi:14187_t:CDS:2, partial [Funneliformis geosporum]
MELNNINVENLGFDHPIYSGILNIKSEPFINISESFYKFIQNEESKINEDEDL